MGQVWSYVLSTSRLAEIVCVIEPDVGLHNKIKEDLKCVVYKTIEEIDGDFFYDILLDVSPPMNRYKNISYAFSKKKNILCEKPLAFNKNELKLILEITNQNPDLVIFVNQNYRWFPWVNIVKSIIDRKNKEGFTLDSIGCNFLQKYIPSGYRLNEEHLYFYDMAIHHIDLFYYLTNDELVKIYAHDSHDTSSRTALGASFIGISIKNISLSYTGSWNSEISMENWSFVFSDGEIVKLEAGILSSNDNPIPVPVLETDRLLISFKKFLERIENKDSFGLCSPREIEKVLVPMLDAEII